LNVVNIIKQLKRAKFMFHALLSKHNRFLFQFQRDQLINPNDIVDEKDQLNDGEVSSGDEKVDFDYKTLSS
jgi:hypothetical protein